MVTRIFAWIALPLLCASSSHASDAVPRNAGRHVRRHVHVADKSAAPSPTATVPERPTIFPSDRPQPYPYNFHETDGLSRNPNDCAVWGCVDSN